MNSPGTDSDKLLAKAYFRAREGDMNAGRFVLIFLHNSLRGQGVNALTDYAREILADMLAQIVQGTDAREVTFTKKGSGNPAWQRHDEISLIVNLMEAKQAQGRGPWQAAGDICGYFGRTQKRTWSIWNERKAELEDPIRRGSFKGS